MTISKATISVVIPCYNAEAYIHETISSALNQTLRPTEILVIDDGSTDNSARIAESFGGSVHVIRQPNQGESVARNKGIQIAKGDWIAFLDADDLWTCQKLQRQIECLKHDTVAVHTNYFSFGDRDDTSCEERVPADVRYSIRRLAEYNCILTSSLLLRRNISPLFPTWTRFGEDLIFNCELSQRGLIELVTEPLTGYRTHASNQSRSAVISLRWLETVDRWLTDFAPDVTSANKAAIREVWVTKVCRAANRAKARRQWDTFEELCRGLSAFRDVAGANSLLSQPVYPRWLYRLHDALSSTLRGATNRFASGTSNTAGDNT